MRNRVTHECEMFSYEYVYQKLFVFDIGFIYIWHAF